MDVMLKSSPSVFRYEYLIDIFAAVLLYSRKTRGITRARGFDLLVRILQEMKPRPSCLPERRVELHKLKGVMKVIENLIDREQGTFLYSSYLQSLLELMVTAHLGLLSTSSEGEEGGLNLPPMLRLFMMVFYRCFLSLYSLTHFSYLQAKKSEIEHKPATADSSVSLLVPTASSPVEAEVLLSHFGLMKIEVKSATFGLTKRVDVTAQVQQLLASQGGALQSILVIPKDFNTIPSWPRGEPGVNNDLKIKFRILSHNNVVLKEQTTNAIVQGKGHLIHADLFTFEKLLEASEISTAVQTMRAFPISFAQDAFRSYALSKPTEKVIVLKGKKHMNANDGFVESGKL
jgi:hypothetical protein